MNDAETTVEALRSWRADPVLMVRQLFNAEPDPAQHQFLRSWASPDPRRRIAMQACAGPGKSAGLAWAGWNALLTRSDGTNHPNGAAISITQDNLKNNLWKELAKWRERSPVLQRAFEFTGSTIFEREHPQTWRLDARSFAKSADADAQGRTLSGLHAESIFYLIDESGDMPPAIGRAADQGLAGRCQWGRIAQAGNPTSHNGLLHHSVTTQSARWDVIRITGDPDSPDRSPRIDLEEARESILLHGRDNAWVMAYVLGLFPPTSLNALLGPDDVRAAMGRHLSIDQYQFAQKRLGIDVARFGDDRTVIFPRQGLRAFNPVVMRQQRANPIAARVAMAKAKWGSELEFIDDTGTWGAGVIDQLITAGHSPIGIPFSAPAIDPRYKNRRAEMWLNMRDWVLRGGALPNIPEMVAELTEPTYTFSNGKFQLEEKDQIKKRLGRSPDLADALALTFALPDMPAAMAGLGLDPAFAAVAAAGGTAGHVVSEFDPWANT